MGEKRLYLRIRGRILGPLGLQQLKTMRDRGQFRRFHEISEDRKNWLSAATLSELFPPEDAVALSSDTELDHGDGQAIAVARKEAQAPPQSVAEWHYVDANEQRQGPFTKDQLVLLYRRGTIHRATPVWKPGMTNWIEFASPELGLAFSTEPASGRNHRAGKASADATSDSPHQTALLAQGMENWQALRGWRALRTGLTLVKFSIFALIGAGALFVVFCFLVYVARESQPAPALDLVLIIIGLLLFFSGQLLETVGYGFSAAASRGSGARGLCIMALILGIAHTLLMVFIFVLSFTAGFLSSRRVEPSMEEEAWAVLMVLSVFAFFLGLAKPFLYQFALRAAAAALGEARLAQNIVYLIIIYGLVAFLQFFAWFLPILYPPLYILNIVTTPARMAMLALNIVTLTLMVVWLVWYVVVLFRTHGLLDAHIEAQEPAS